MKTRILSVQLSIGLWFLIVIASIVQVMSSTGVDVFWALLSIRTT